MYTDDCIMGRSCLILMHNLLVVMYVTPFLAAQRFRNVPSNVTLEEGKPVNISVCYPQNFPESANLSSITLVEEATGNITTAPLNLTNYCAEFSLKDKRPGLYYFEVNFVQGAISSRSFNISLQGMY